MAELRLRKLPDRARVKIAIAVDSDLALALRDDLSDRIWRRRIRRRAHSLHAERISAKRPRLRQSAKGIVARAPVETEENRRPRRSPSQSRSTPSKDD
jgi:hypothetical protein